MTPSWSGSSTCCSCRGLIMPGFSCANGLGMAMGSGMGMGLADPSA
jgi:hypothetical protein